MSHHTDRVSCRHTSYIHIHHTDIRHVTPHVRAYRHIQTHMHTDTRHTYTYIIQTYRMMIDTAYRHTCLSTTNTHASICLYTMNASIRHTDTHASLRRHTYTYDTHASLRRHTYTYDTHASRHTCLSTTNWGARPVT